jgi:hypothetical protein
MIIDAQGACGSHSGRPFPALSVSARIRRADPRLPPLPLPGASSGRQIGAVIIILGQGGIYGYLRGRVTGLPADPGQSAPRG